MSCLVNGCQENLWAISLKCFSRPPLAVSSMHQLFKLRQWTPSTTQCLADRGDAPLCSLHEGCVMQLVNLHLAKASVFILFTTFSFIDYYSHANVHCRTRNS